MVIYMSRRATEVNAEMSEFALWLLRACERAGMSQSRLSELAGLDRSYLNRIMNSYKPAYRYYKRPSYEKTLAIGQVLRDIRGAMQAAGHIDEYEQRTGQAVSEIEYAPDPTIQMIVEAYSGGTDTGKRAIKSAAELALEMSREGAHGRRAD